MSSAAPAATPAERQSASTRRKARPSLTRRTGLQLLAGLLVVAGIPVVATVRILDANAILNGKTFGTVVGTVALDRRLVARLLQASPHARGDKLLLVRVGVVVGSSERIRVANSTVDLAGERYRGHLLPAPNAPHTKLVALRPDAAIHAAVRPYQERVMYAALGSFGLLVLVGLLFGGPILRTLGDFRRVASHAKTDSPTGLPNRWAFDEEVALEGGPAERCGDPLGVMLGVL